MVKIWSNTFNMVNTCVKLYMCYITWLIRDIWLVYGEYINGHFRNQDWSYLAFVRPYKANAREYP